MDHAASSSAIAFLVLLAGCGLDVQIMGPETATPGQMVSYQVKLTNVSACPLPALVNNDDDGNFALIPFLPQSVIEDDVVFSAFCGLSEAPPIGLSTSLAGAGDIPVQEARDMLFGLAAGAAPASCSASGVTCGPIPDDQTPAGGVLCDVGSFAPNQMKTLTCQATVPAGGGPLFTLAFVADFVAGVCKAGTNQGAACRNDTACGGTMDACGEGICDGGSNDGNGCDTALAECPGGTCIECDENVALGLACAQLDVASAVGAPALSPWGLALVVVLLIGLAATHFMRRRGAV